MRILTLFLLVVFYSCLFGQERYTEIDQQKYRIKEFGEGSITVVFENGMSDSLEIWGSIPDSVAKFARVFLYDRADIGKSDTSGNSRTIPNIVMELRSILKKEDITPPYVLVGHSLGGLIVRYFASEYPDEVNGMMLLDPAPESFWKKMSDKDLKEYIRGGNEWYETKFAPKYRKEWHAFIPNLAYMDNLNINEKLPVILVSATAWKWYKYHKNIIKGYKNVKHYEWDGEHHIFKNNQDKTVECIKALINGQL